MFDALMIPPEFKLPQHYSNVIKTLGMAILYMPALPVSPLLGLIGLCIAYWVDKIVALRLTRKPPQLSYAVVVTLFHIMRLLPLAQIGLVWRLYYDLDCPRETAADSKPCDAKRCQDKKLKILLLQAASAVVWVALAWLPVGLLLRLDSRPFRIDIRADGKCVAYTRVFRRRGSHGSVANRRGLAQIPRESDMYSVTVTKSGQKTKVELSRDETYAPALPASCSRAFRAAVDAVYTPLQSPLPPIREPMSWQSLETSGLVLDPPPETEIGGVAVIQEGESPIVARGSLDGFNGVEIGVGVENASTTGDMNSEVNHARQVRKSTDDATTSGYGKSMDSLHSVPVRSMFALDVGKREFGKGPSRTTLTRQKTNSQPLQPIKTKHTLEYARLELELGSQEQLISQTTTWQSEELRTIDLLQQEGEQKGGWQVGQGLRLGVELMRVDGVRVLEISDRAQGEGEGPGSVPRSLGKAAQWVGSPLGYGLMGGIHESMEPAGEGLGEQVQEEVMDTKRTCEGCMYWAIDAGDEERTESQITAEAQKRASAMWQISGVDNAPNMVVADSLGRWTGLQSQSYGMQHGQRGRGDEQRQSQQRVERRQLQQLYGKDVYKPPDN